MGHLRIVRRPWYQLAPRSWHDGNDHLDDAFEERRSAVTMGEKRWPAKPSQVLNLDTQRIGVAALVEIRESVGQERALLPVVETCPAAGRFGHLVEVDPSGALQIACFEPGRDGCETGAQLGQIGQAGGLGVEQIEEGGFMNGYAAQ